MITPHRTFPMFRTLAGLARATARHKLGMAALALAACALTPTAQAGGDVHPAAKPASEAAEPEAQGIETVDYDPNDPDIQAAVREAQATLTRFFKATAGNSLASNVAVKIEVREGATREYLWVTPFHPVDKDGRFMGTVNDIPHKVHQVATGDNVSFRRADIVDWAYIDLHERSLKGNYTTCVMLKRASQAERDQLRQSYGLDCDKH